MGRETAISTHSNTSRSISMIIYSIYRFTNTTNNKIYIGWTSRDPLIRLDEHQSTSTPKYQDRSIISYAIEKYGINSFVFEIVYQSSDYDHSREMESVFIKENNSLLPDLGGWGYNIDFGGTGHKRSPLTIEKHRKAITGKKQSAEHIDRRKVIGDRNAMYGRTGKNHPRYGKKLTDEQRQNVSDGVKQSVKDRKEAGTYVPPKLTVESINKMKATKKAQAERGELYSQTAEGRAAISAALMGRVQTVRQKDIAKEANTGVYEVESESGEVQTVRGLKIFAKSIGLTIDQLRYTLTSGKFRNGFRLVKFLGKQHQINIGS